MHRWIDDEETSITSEDSSVGGGKDSLSLDESDKMDISASEDTSLVENWENEGEKKKDGDNYDPMDINSVSLRVFHRYVLFLIFRSLLLRKKMTMPRKRSKVKT